MARKRTKQTKRTGPTAAPRTGANRSHRPNPLDLEAGRNLTGPILGPIGQVICDAVDPSTGEESFLSLAESIGTSRQNLQRLISGSVDPKASVLSLIADHFGLSLQPVRGRRPRGR